MRDRMRADARDTLFGVMGRVHAGMLGVEGSGQHLQPMSHFLDAETGEIWFVGSESSDLVRAIGQGAQAQYAIISKDHDLHACMRGYIEQSQDRAKLDALWSPVLSAWFEGGRDDPDIALLRMTLRDAAVWASTGSAVVFATEIARANLAAEHEPDVGERTVIEFNAAA